MLNWFLKIRSFQNEVRARTLNTQITAVFSSGGVRPAEDFTDFQDWINLHREQIDRQEYADTCEMIMDFFDRCTWVRVSHGGSHFGAVVSR